MTQGDGSDFGPGEIHGGQQRVVGWYVSQDHIGEVKDETLEGVLRVALGEAARRRWSRVRVNRWFRAGS